MDVSIFSVIYVLTSIVIFYCLRYSSRFVFLVISSLAYVFILDKTAGTALLATFVFAYLAGLLIGAVKPRSSRVAVICLAFSVFVCVISLCFLKFSGRSGLFIPIGFSFYIFQTISYLVDIYRGKTAAEKKPARLFLYLAWFPKFVSGPIERKDKFDEQLNNIRIVRFRDPQRWVRIAHYVIIGFFYKLVIADRLCKYVDKLFSDYQNYDGAWLILGVIMYTFQIYFDFAGYSYAAIGISEAFGIKVSTNFKMPYLSENITEFWRRWHITLSSWLRDYVYIPLGGNRKGKLRKIINTIMVFAVCGVWHGGDISFVIWGLLHGAYASVDTVLSDKGYDRLRKGTVGRIITFLLVAFAWLFFRSANITEALGYIKCMMVPGRIFDSFLAQRQELGFWLADILIIVLSIMAVLYFECCAYKRLEDVPEVIIRKTYPIRYLYAFIALTMIMVFGMYGPESVVHMIYMQF
ncbi:MAG: hypothetical protein K6A38_06045 [Lachnospiraceae bacterium]|nr:hypothetical protein [Lachnospiraceae bacterium]